MWRRSFVGYWLAVGMAVGMVLAACSGGEGRARRVDALNDKAYSFHYVSLDSTLHYAMAAYAQSGSYTTGAMAALNNIAFVELATMDYSSAEGHLLTVLDKSDDQLERLVANVQMMRLCQRTSRNHAFYRYYWAAASTVARLREDPTVLTAREEQRRQYGETELQIVYAAYLYYVGQMDAFRSALRACAPLCVAGGDTAQHLNYLYNIGSGEFFVDGSAEDNARAEVSALVDCYFLAARSGQQYWQANALQALSEHLVSSTTGSFVGEEYRHSLRAIGDEEHVADSLSAISYAQRALSLFVDYGDTYQTAGALRTLADCYFHAGLYDNAITSLDLALVRDSAILRSPSLTASLYERLSISYAAAGDKPRSDYYRNLYLDTQEDTRQDRELDVRAEELYTVSHQLNYILLFLLVAVVVLCLLLAVALRRRGTHSRRVPVRRLLLPLEQWKEQHAQRIADDVRHREALAEEQGLAALTRERNMQINIEQRAKVALLAAITPLINSILSESDKLRQRQESAERQAQRYAYLSALADTITAYNDVLTRWIQLRKGSLTVKIETFALQELFSLVAQSKASFARQGISLVVEDTGVLVKADRALTLFMLNTLTANARRALEEETEKCAANAGKITISAAPGDDDSVSIAVEDNGCGMEEEQLAALLSRREITASQHGFGLLNCRGILERYKKESSLFRCCSLTATSTPGKGTTFRFRLPRGARRLAVIAAAIVLSLGASAASSSILEEGKTFADSTYFCNLQGRYDDAITFACRSYHCLNQYYLSLYPSAVDTLEYVGTGTPAEVQWLREGAIPLAADSALVYGTLLDIRNETAVAALARHDWQAYHYNNTAYIRLFHDVSSDHELPVYIHKMQQVGSAKNIAIILLALVVLVLVVAYYFLYYRHRVAYNALLEQVNRINAILLASSSDEEKLSLIRSLWEDSLRHTPTLTHEYAARGGLDAVVAAILGTLTESVEAQVRSAEDEEYAHDELRRLRYESDALHVQNSVLDNCLSAVKHETMYYPSRLQQLIADPSHALAPLDEVAHYYQLLFAVLSRQAQEQVQSPLPVDDEMKKFLRSTLLSLFEGPPPTVQHALLGDHYETFTCTYPSVPLTDDEIHNLFLPLTTNLRCLVLRQIVREMAESTNRYGCGVRAARRADDSGALTVTVTLSCDIKFTL